MCPDYWSEIDGMMDPTALIFGLRENNPSGFLLSEENAYVREIVYQGRNMGSRINRFSWFKLNKSLAQILSPDIDFYDIVAERKGYFKTLTLTLT